MKKYITILAATLISSFTETRSDMLPSPFPYDIKESNGNIIEGVKLKGTSLNLWEESSEGYTFVDGANGLKVYAKKDPRTGSLVPTDFLVGGNIELSRLGLEKHLRPDIEAVIHSKKSHGKGPDNEEEINFNRDISPRSSSSMKNLVVSIRFSDHVGRILPSEQDLDTLFNANAPVSTIAPTGGVKKVFEVSSFGSLDLQSTILPIYTVSQSESYYADGNRGFTGKFWEAIKEALQHADDNNLISFGDFDEDNDGYIDAITILHSGYAAEWGGTDCTGAHYMSRIWSHKWQMSPSWSSSDQVRVWKYHASPLLWGKCGDDIGRIGVIAHETGHFFGLPDLYDTSGTGSGIGSFGLMANSWGFDGSQYYPPIMSPWSKNELGWLNCPVLDITGTYTLRRSSEFNECFKIVYGFQSREYLYIENRNKHSFDFLPQNGLVIWHVDELGNHNNEGYPGKSGWPSSGDHYITPLLQADGNYDLEKGNGRGDGGDVFHGGAGGIDRLLPSNDVLTGPFPNTDSYQGGNMIQTGIKISNISASGASITFDVELGSETAAPVSSPSASPTSSPTKLPTSSPTKSPTSSPTKSPTSSPTESPTSSTKSPTSSPTKSPTSSPTESPTSSTKSPTSSPTESPTSSPTESPTSSPTNSQTSSPTESPTSSPTKSPTSSPTKSPTSSLTKSPTSSPTKSTTSSPTNSPTPSPTESPSSSPTKSPTSSPTKSPTSSPTESPTSSPTKSPTSSPSKSPISSPTESPTSSPTELPTFSPTESSTSSPTESPTSSPTESPTSSPTESPTSSPTESPTSSPTKVPTSYPTESPTSSPTRSTTSSPTKSPTSSPTKSPTSSPTESPTSSPTRSPTSSPTRSPTSPPTKFPTELPTIYSTKMTSSPTKYPTLSPSNTIHSCWSNFCKKRNWKKNCSKDRAKCGACPECFPNPNKCMRKHRSCLRGSWKKRCNKKSCAACAECRYN